MPAGVGDLQWERHGARVRRWDVEGVVVGAHLRPVARAAAPRWQQQAGGAARARETTTYLHTLPKSRFLVERATEDPGAARALCGP